MYDPSTGIWRSDAGLRAGLYAVVIGISRYPYLRGGDSCTVDPYNFGQLVSSAHTAHKFFRWLTESYRFEGCPVRECRLLLGPVAAERPHVAIDSPEPTLENICAALVAWRNALVSLSGPGAADSRALFFFSGHGLERDMDQQLLLPSDYWSNGMVNKAINSKNLQEGLAASQVPWQVFIIDACRNDPFILEQFANVNGIQVLPSTPGRRFFRTAPIMYGSASGQSAWQVDDPAQPTIFGQAVLDALNLAGTPPLEPDCTNDPCVIDLSRLYAYVNARVSHLLTQLPIREADPDPVVLGGVIRGKTPICHVAEPHGGGPLPSAEERLAHALSMGSDNVSSWFTSEAVAETFSPCGHGSVAPLAPDMRLDASPYERIFEGYAEAGSASFESEMIAIFFRAIKVYVWQRSWVAQHDTLFVRSVDRSGDDRLFRVTFEFRDATAWHWVECDDFRSRSKFAFFFPGLRLKTTDEQQRQIFELQMAVDDSGNIRFARSSLSLSNTGLIGEAALLWHKYRSESAQSAAEALSEYAVRSTGTGQVSLKHALRLLFEKYTAPLAATVGALILTRAGAYDLMRDWLDNLVAIGYGSDAAVFALKRNIEIGRTADLNHYFSVIGKQGMPFTSEATSYLWQILNPDSHPEISEARSELGLDALRARLSDLYAGFRTGGLFTSFAAVLFNLDPEKGLVPIRSLYL